MFSPHARLVIFRLDQPTQGHLVLIVTVTSERATKGDVVRRFRGAHLAGGFGACEGHRGRGW